VCEGVDWIQLAQNSLVANSCEHFNKPSVFIGGGGVFPDYLSEFHLLSDSDPWSRQVLIFLGSLKT